MLSRALALVTLFGLATLAAPASGQEPPKAAHEVLIQAPTTLSQGSKGAVRVVVYLSSGLDRVVAVEGAEVTLKLADAKGGETSLWSGRTGSAGAADVAFAVPEVDDGDYTLVIETKSSGGEHTAKQPVRLRREFKVLMVTDKPLYQPGQEIRIRALALDPMTMNACGDRDLLLEIEDAKGNKVFKRSAKTDRFGVAACEFQLADEVNLGDYRVSATVAGAKAEKSVTVKKYVLPKFRVELKTDKKFYLPKETVKGTLQADYFFGKPVAGGQVVVRASTFDVQFREFATAKVKTDEKGAAEFELALPEYFVGTPLAKGNAFVQIEAEVLDTADHVERVAKSVPVANDPIVVGAIPESGRLVPGLENLVHVVASTPDGSPVEADVSLRVGKDEATGRTNPSGYASLKITPRGEDLAWDDRGGRAAKATVTAKDRTGASATREVTLSSEFGKDQLLLRLDRALYSAGESAVVEALGTFGDRDVYVDVVRRGQTVLTAIARMEKGRATMNLPFTADLFGTLEIHAYAFLGTADIVRDTKVVFVNPASQLRVDVEADRPQYRPGEEAVLKFRVTDGGGEGVSSALGVIIVDESVYALQEMQPGLEKVYFMLEKELLEPRVEVRLGGSVPGMIEAPRPAGGEEAKLRDGAAMILLAPVTLPQRHATVNTLATRLASMANQVQVVYYALNNLVLGNREVFWQVGTGGRREFKAGLLDDLVKRGLLKKEQLVDPWGRTMTLDELGALSKVFSFEYWARAISVQNHQIVWQAMWSYVGAHDALVYDAAAKSWSWKKGVLDDMVGAKVLTGEQARDGFGDPLDLEKLGADDPAWKAENFAKVARNARLQAVWNRVLERVATQGGLSHDGRGARWDDGVLERWAEKDAELAKAIARPEGGRYTLAALGAEVPSFAAGNVAKIASLSRRQAVYNALAEATKREGFGKIAEFDAKAGAWAFQAGLLKRLVEGRYLTEAQTRDVAGREFDLAELSREDAQFAATRFVSGLLRQAATDLDGAICRTYHRQKNALPEGDVIAKLAEDGVVREADAKDPWGTLYRLVPVKEGRGSGLRCGLLSRKFTILSAGPDGKFETGDDLNAGGMPALAPYRPNYAGCVFYQPEGVQGPSWYGELEDEQNFGFAEGHGGGAGGRFDRRLRKLQDGAKELRGGMPPPAPGAAADPRRPGDANKPMERQLKDAEFEKAKGDAGAADEAGGAPVRVREYFPETLAWEPRLITDGDGRAELKLTMADSITTWRLTASANTADGRLGSATKGLLVFQDFFIDIDLPVSLTQNDVLSIPVAVYNYLRDAQTVELSIEKNDWFELRDEERKTVEVGPGEVKAVYYRIRALKLGPANPLTVHAKGAKMSDAIRRAVEVLPDGRAVEAVFNGRLKDGVRHTLNVPATAVEGGTKILFKIYPGLFATVIDGLEGMLRLPGG